MKHFKILFLSLSVFVCVQFVSSQGLGIGHNSEWFCGFEEAEDTCGIQQTGRWSRESRPEAGQRIPTGPQNGGASGTDFYLVMKADNNEKGERCSLSIGLTTECRHDFEMFYYMYGWGVETLGVWGFNFVNNNFEKLYEVDRLGILATPTFKLDTEDMDLRVNSSGIPDWQNLYLRLNFYAQVKIVALNGENEFGDIAVDQIHIYKTWCDPGYLKSYPDIVLYTPIPKTEPPTTLPEGVLYRVDFSKVNVFGNDFANSVNSDLDDADWSLGDSSVAFENSPPEHAKFLYVTDENLPVEGIADLVLPSIGGGKCLIMFFRIYRSPVMALFIIKKVNGVETKVRTVQVSDPSELLSDWSKIVVNIDASANEQWLIRAFKQDLGQTFRRGGHLEIDDITVYDRTCDEVTEARGVLARQSENETFSLKNVRKNQQASRLAPPARASASSAKDDSEMNKNLAIGLGTAIPVLLIAIGVTAGILIARNRRKSQDLEEQRGGYPPENYDENFDNFGDPNYMSDNTSQATTASAATATPGVPASPGGLASPRGLSPTPSSGRSSSRGGSSLHPSARGSSVRPSVKGSSIRGDNKPSSMVANESVARGMMSADAGSFAESQMVSAAADEMVTHTPEP